MTPRNGTVAETHAANRARSDQRRLREIAVDVDREPGVWPGFDQHSKGSGELRLAARAVVCRLGFFEIRVVVLTHPTLESGSLARVRSPLAPLFQAPLCSIPRARSRL